MEISVQEFVLRLWKEFFCNPCEESIENRPLGLEVRPLGSSMLHFQKSEEILHYGHVRGWLEDQDERYSDSVLVKRSAARILHQFIKIELKLSDREDISAAECLKDLYTCRVCVNHVAQIYLNGIMESEEIEQNGEFVQVFNMMKPVTENDADEIFERLRCFVK